MSGPETLERIPSGIILPKDQSIDALNQDLGGLTAEESIEYAHERFGGGLRFLTSGGADSALLLSRIKNTGLPIKGFTLDTGFRFASTGYFIRDLEGWSGLEIDTVRADESAIEKAEREMLWETDKELYHKLTKLDTMALAVEALGVTAVLAGVRHDQTKNRAGLHRAERGNDGELRIHPILEWTGLQVEEIFESEGLPRHPLYYEGYESIGDWTTTVRGRGREGRDLGEGSECGINVLPLPDRAVA